MTSPQESAHTKCPDCGVVGVLAHILKVFWADVLADRAQIEQWRCPEGHVWKVGRRAGA